MGAMRRQLFLLIVLLLQVVCCVADTIPLQVVQTAPRTVQLSWSTSAATTIFRQYPEEGVPVAIATVSGTQYVDHQCRAVCDDTVRYSISQQIGATLNEGYASQLMTDNEPTSPAEWGVVSVDQSGQTLRLQWEPSADTDIMGYMVCEGSPSIAIDTVFGRLNTQYTPADYPVDSVWHFRICAFDSCRQASALTEVCNNLVVTLSSEPCDRQVTLQWNEYLNMPDGVQRYEVWVSEDGGIMRHEVDVDAGGPMHALFTVAESTMSVAAEVRAVSADGQHFSRSNRVGETFATSERPAYFYLRKVSVCDDNVTVHLLAQTDPTYSGTDYTVYRSDDHGASYAVGQCHPEVDGTLRWTDHNAHPAEHVYTYWLGVVDGCGRNELFTQQGSTLLPILEKEGATLRLTWNTYEGWEGTTQYVVSAYDVDHNPLATHSTTSTSLTLQSGEQGPQLFRISAFEGANSQYTHADSLQSATVTHHPQTTMWVPNAFAPDENANNHFRPYFSYVDPDSYHFAVYNRQGMLLFATSDPNTAWDGTAQGQPQPQGVYVYKVEYQASNMPQYKLGTVLLIR